MNGRPGSRKKKVDKHRPANKVTTKEAKMHRPSTIGTTASSAVKLPMVWEEGATTVAIRTNHVAVATAVGALHVYTVADGAVAKGMKTKGTQRKAVDPISKEIAIAAADPAVTRRAVEAGEDVEVVELAEGILKGAIEVTVDTISRSKLGRIRIHGITVRPSLQITLRVS